MQVIQNKIFLSIIIPAFNVKEELEKLLKQLSEIENSQIEILIIDDGSTDNTGNMVERHVCESSKKNWIFIKKKNGGLSDTRNYGLEIAKGKYVWFVDSDDIIDVNQFIYVFNYLKETEVDLVTIGFSSFKNDEKLFFDKQKNQFRVETPEKILHSLYLRKIDNYAWSFIAKKSIYVDNRIKFPKRNFEDYATTYKILMRIKTVSCYDGNVYFYRYRDSSIVNNDGNTLKNAQDILTTSLEILSDLDKDSELKREFVLSFLLYAYNTLYHGSSREIKFRHKLRKYIIKFDLTGFPLKKRIIMFLFKIGIYQIIKAK